MFTNLSKENKDQVLSKIQEYFYIERGEEVGLLAAEQLFEFIQENIAAIFYNQGIQDAKKMVDQKLMNIDEDILSLERPLHSRRR